MPDSHVALGGIDLVAGTVAAFGALLVYDVFFVTFEQEVSLVWPSRWTYGKVLFLLNRYLPFVDTFLSLHLLTGKNTDRGCLLGFRAVTWLIVIGIIIAELILMIRTYALWGQKRSILIILMVLGLGVYIPAIVITQIEINSLAYGALSTGRCEKTKNSSPIIFVAFLLLIICETSIVILTLIRARAHLREMRTPLVFQLYKDGLHYYLYLLAFSLVNLIIAVAAPPEFANWLTTPQRVIHSLLSTRVLLHIREHATLPDSQVLSTQPSISFATHADPDAWVVEQAQQGRGRSEISSGSDKGFGSGAGTASGSETSGSRTLHSTSSSTRSQGSRGWGVVGERRAGAKREDGSKGEAVELQSLSRGPLHVNFRPMNLEDHSEGWEGTSFLSERKKGKAKEKEEQSGDV